MLKALSIISSGAVNARCSYLPLRLPTPQENCWSLGPSSWKYSRLNKMQHKKLLSRACAITVVRLLHWGRCRTMPSTGRKTERWVKLIAPQRPWQFTVQIGLGNRDFWNTSSLTTLCILCDLSWPQVSTRAPSGKTGICPGGCAKWFLQLDTRAVPFQQCSKYGGNWNSFSLLMQIWMPKTCKTSALRCRNIRQCILLL